MQRKVFFFDKRESSDHCLIRQTCFLPEAVPVGAEASGG